MMIDMLTSSDAGTISAAGTTTGTLFGRLATVAISTGISVTES
jgi:hypothetical protein